MPVSPPSPSLPPELWLDLVDSEVASLREEADGWCLRLAVARTRPAVVRPGEGDAAGYLRGVRLHFMNARVEGDAKDSLGAIVEARCLRDGERLVGLAIPSTLRGALHLTLGFRHHDIRLSADGLAVTLGPDAVWRASFAC